MKRPLVVLLHHMNSGNYLVKGHAKDPSRGRHFYSSLLTTCKICVFEIYHNLSLAREGRKGKIDGESLKHLILPPSHPPSL
jgi:hypothetical protein